MIQDILQEFEDGKKLLEQISNIAVFFGSARTPVHSKLYNDAVNSAKLVANLGYNIVTGGGPGIMEAANNGCKLTKQTSIGLNIKLPMEQKLNPYTDKSIDFKYFFTRKFMLTSYAEVFVVFPGGFGTLDELFETMTLMQTEKIKKQPILLYDKQYWEPMLIWLEQTLLKDKMIDSSDMDLFHLVDSPEEVASTIKKIKRI